MIQLSALTAPAALGAASDAPQAQPGDGAETADFGALLTAQTAPQDLPASTQAAVPAASMQIQAPDSAPPTPLPDFAALPESGKILPDGLPLALPLVQPGICAAAAAGNLDPKAEAAALPGKAQSLADETDESAPAPVSAEAALAPWLALAPALAPTLAASQAATAQDATPAASSGRSQSGADIPLPLPTAAPAVPVAQESAAGEQAPQLPVLEIGRAALPASAAIALQDAAPSAVSGGVTARIKLNPAAAAASEGEAAASEGLAALFAAQPQATAPTSPATALPTAAIQPASRPHDFAALVDSLVAAREAAQPHAVSIALATAEFGAVQLRFSQDDAGLSVTMASADPDFARAASAAMPPPAAAAATDNSAQQNGARQQTQTGQQSGGTNAGGGGSSQGGNASSSQQQERSAARNNPSPRASAPPAGSIRSGIFA